MNRERIKRITTHVIMRERERELFQKLSKNICTYIISLNDYVFRVVRNEEGM